MAKQTVYDWEKHRDHLLMEVERLTYQRDVAQRGVAGLAELQDRVDELCAANHEAGQRHRALKDRIAKLILMDGES